MVFDGYLPNDQTGDGCIQAPFFFSVVIPESDRLGLSGIARVGEGTLVASEYSIGQDPERFAIRARGPATIHFH